MKTNKDLLVRILGWCYISIIILSTISAGWYGVLRAVFFQLLIIVVVCVIIQASGKMNMFCSWLNKNLIQGKFGIKWFSK